MRRAAAIVVLLGGAGVARADEVERVRRHLLGAEQSARAEPTDHLSADRRAKRAAALDTLSAYRARGLFPKNLDFANPMPYFVDEAGTRCAMAELIHATGDVALVDAVRRTNNNAFVRELASEPALLEWLDQNGLTVEEAAAIQPSYCSTRSTALCGYYPNGPSPTAIVEAVHIGDEMDEAIYVVTRVVYGALPGGGTEYRKMGWGPNKAVLVFRESERFDLFALLDDGFVQLAQDPVCDGVPRSRLEDLIVAWTSGVECMDRVEALHPGWATARCFDDRDPQSICQAPLSDPLPMIPRRDPPVVAGEEDAAEMTGCRTARGELSLLLLLAFAFAYVLKR